uniref:Uncharacterized protein n=1 Tax=Anguilla anguilla TaxID=7936 RepID=A0A0E9PJL4_ANGAN
MLLHYLATFVHSQQLSCRLPFRANSGNSSYPGSTFWTV